MRVLMSRETSIQFNIMLCYIFLMMHNPTNLKFHFFIFSFFLVVQIFTPCRNLRRSDHSSAEVYYVMFHQPHS